MHIKRTTVAKNVLLEKLNVLFYVLYTLSIKRTVAKNVLLEKLNALTQETSGVLQPEVSVKAKGKTLPAKLKTHSGARQYTKNSYGDLTPFLA